jgi:hypothetical protein
MSIGLSQIAPSDDQIEDLVATFSMPASARTRNSARSSSVIGADWGRT